MNIFENATGIQHLGIPTRDVEATIAFYKGLGFSMMWRSPEGFAHNVAFLKLHDLVVETYQSDEVAGKAGAIDHVAINVRDIDAAFEFAKAGGYRLIDEAVNYLNFLENGVRYFTILGPNEEKVEFNQIL